VTTFVIKKDGTQSLGRRNPKDRLWGHRQNHMSGKKAAFLIARISSDPRILFVVTFSPFSSTNFEKAF